MEYWQQILDRAEATIPVWQQYFPTLALGATNLAAFTTLKDSLPTLAQTRDNNVQTVDNARQAKEFAWLSLRLISLKIPAICEGVLDPDSGLLDDLGKIYAIVPWSPDKTLARCKLLGPFWAAANSWQAAQIPSRPPIVRNTVSQSIFMSSIATYYPLSQADADAGQDLDDARGNLRRTSRRVEQLCVRFLSAARGFADPGTAAEQALATIPTTTTSQLPETLGIKTLTQGGTGGLELLIQYEPYSLEPGETAEIQWMVVDTDTGFTHSAAYDASGNALGPFLLGQTVRLRTAVTNAHGTRTGGVRQLTLIAPPE